MVLTNFQKASNENSHLKDFYDEQPFFKLLEKYSLDEIIKLGL